MAQQTIFSGIQPSGNLHLGNYLGALNNWLQLQQEFNSIFCVVDLHAITTSQEPAVLQEKTIEIAKIYLAAGIDPEKSSIFVQSHVPAHTELMWILNTIAKIAELEKMTQFKDKTGKKLGIDAGLLNYPVLMAADILLYDTDVVPVGEDQLQHIELARDLAKRFNHRYGETFKIPKAFIKEEGMRIMGLDDPTKKMSKSADSKYNRIELLDSPDAIRDKVKKAVTDSGQTIEYTDERPGLKNLLNIFASVIGQKPQAIAENYLDKGYKIFKEELAEAVITFLAPFQEKYTALNDEEVLIILQKGAQKVAPLADKKLQEVKQKIGLLAGK